MARIRGNYVSGTTTDDPLLVGATTLNSASLANLPAVTGSDVAAITLHDGTNFEIVHVTAHTAAATSATILRAQEGTTAQEWPTGTTWLHGTTAADLPIVSDTEPAEPEVGQVWIGPAAAPSGGSSITGALAYKSTGTQAITNATFTAITLDAESYDDATYHDTATNTSRLTIATAGRYRISCQLEFANNTTGIRMVSIWKNGVSTGTRLAQVSGMPPTDTSAARLQAATPILTLAVGDYVEMAAYHTVGANLNVTAAQGVGSTWLCIERIS